MLTTIPREVGEIISSFLPDKYVAIMQRVCKRMQTVTQNRLQQICCKLPTTNEVVSHIISGLNAPILQTIGFFRPRHGNKPTRYAILRILNGVVGHRYAEIVYSDNEWFVRRGSGIHLMGNAPSDGYTLSDIGMIIHYEVDNGCLIDPRTLLLTLQRRLGCKKYQLGAVGVELIRACMMNVLSPLSPFLGNEADILEPAKLQAKLIAATNEQMGQQLSTAEDLHVAVYWLSPSEQHLTTIDAVTVGATQISNRWLEISTRINSAFVMLNERTLKKFFSDNYIQSPTPICIYEYIQQQLLANHPFKVAFYSQNYIIQFGSAVSKHVLTVIDMKNSKEGTYRTYTVTVEDFIKGKEEKMHQHSESATYFLSLLKKYGKKAIPRGIVDPCTMLALMDRHSINTDAYKSLILDTMLYEVSDVFAEKLKQGYQPTPKEVIQHINTTKLCHRLVALYGMWCDTSQATMKKSIGESIFTACMNMINTASIL